VKKLKKQEKEFFKNTLIILGIVNIFMILKKVKVYGNYLNEKNKKPKVILMILLNKTQILKLLI